MRFSPAWRNIWNVAARSVYIYIPDLRHTFPVRLWELKHDKQVQMRGGFILEEGGLLADFTKHWLFASCCWGLLKRQPCIVSACHSLGRPAASTEVKVFWQAAETDSSAGELYFNELIIQIIKQGRSQKQVLVSQFTELLRKQTWDEKADGKFWVIYSSVWHLGPGVRNYTVFMIQSELGNFWPPRRKDPTFRLIIPTLKVNVF